MKSDDAASLLCVFTTTLNLEKDIKKHENKVKKQTKQKTLFQIEFSLFTWLCQLSNDDSICKMFHSPSAKLLVQILISKDLMVFSLNYILTLRFLNQCPVCFNNWAAASWDVPWFDGFSWTLCEYLKMSHWRVKNSDERVEEQQHINIYAFILFVGQSFYFVCLFVFVFVCL